MIRQVSTNDNTSIAIYLSKKLNLSFSDAYIKTRKIIKSGLISLIKEDKDLEGICWVETKFINNKKEKFVEIYVNNWRLAESFIQILRWSLTGIYYFSLSKHDMLNRTLNKSGIRFLKVEGDKNIYNYKFEKRYFQSYKSEDNEE